MIISENTSPTLDQFKLLMSTIDTNLNSDAKSNEEYYSKRSGQSLEKDVERIAIQSAIGTPFENSIKLVSGKYFPDIVAAKFYGIEVKSTEKNQWTSIGSSILESTRIDGVERIFLTFGKLGKPVEFKSRPYEECLSGIAVTHYPRYQINMELASGETIFDKMGIEYDSLRKLDNPVAPVAEYYKKKLKPGERLWWTGDNAEAAVPATVKLWTAVSPADKRVYEATIYALFPETILSHSTTKYNEATLWLATQGGIINNNFRDSFSAGGRCSMKTIDGKMVIMPQIINKISANLPNIVDVLTNTPSNELNDSWRYTVKRDRIMQWIDLVVGYAPNQSLKENAKNVLLKLFKDFGAI